MKISKIFSYRSAWMGFAALWVVFYHSAFGMPNPLLDFLKASGDGGVDIFMFASGIGCMFSLSSSSSGQFLRRRINRIIPIWWAFLILMWIPYSLTFGSIPLKAFIGYFTCIQPITGNGYIFSWYISGVWTMYLLAPAFYGILRENRRSIPGVMVLLTLLPIPFFDSWGYPVRCMKLIVKRLAVFFTGMSVGCIEPEYKVNKRQIIAIESAMVAGFFLLRYLSKCESEFRIQAFIFVVPGICLAISGILSLLEKSCSQCFINRVLSLVGRYSFEVFLVHVFIYDVIENYPSAFLSRRMSYILGSLAIIPGVFILKLVKKPILKLLMKTEFLIDVRTENL